MVANDKNIIGELRDLSKSSRRNKTARLRDIFDEIESAKAAGVSNKVIVDTLQKNGIFFDVNNFKNARSRILKEREISALTQSSGAVIAKPKVITKPAVLQAYHPKKEIDNAALKNSGGPDLVRPEGITDAAWKDMKVQNLVNKHKLNSI